MAQNKAPEAKEAIDHALQLTDLRPFPILSLPLQILRARAKVALAKSDKTEIRAAVKELHAATSRAQQLGLYGIAGEGRLAEGEVSMKLNPQAGRSQLAALADESHEHGFELFSS